MEKKQTKHYKLAKKNEAEINEISNHQIQIKNELPSELKLTLKNEIDKLNNKKLEA